MVSAKDEHVGKSTQWGGALIEARHLKGTTELEVVAYPLDKRGRPRTGSGRVGRFVIVRPRFLDTADYETGAHHRDPQGTAGGSGL